MSRPTSSRRYLQRPQWTLSSLEPRLMLAADAGAAVTEAATSQPVQETAAEVRSLTSPADASKSPLDHAGQIATRSAGVVVFVDESVSELTDVADAIDQGADLVLISSETDGVKQIRDYLQRTTGVRQVHILSHGSAGQLQLGSAVLSGQTLGHYAEDLRGWGQTLAAGADLMLYGCDVAANTDGRSLVNEIGRLSGTDVAASNDRTANDRHHGDWDLEYVVGDVDSPLAISAEAMRAFEGHLGIEIRAAGSLGEEQMQLQIGDQVVQTFTVTNRGVFGRNYESYFADIDGANINDIRINFVNSVFDPATGRDGNLGVDWIKVDGVQYETEDPSTFSTGTWLPGQGITPGFKQSEILHADGYFQFAGPDAPPSGDGSVIRIFASGSTGDEQMRLLIDGEDVATFRDVSTQGEVFTFQADSDVTADQVRLVFDNDLFAPPIDRNLTVDRIEIDGVTFQTEDPSTLNSAGYIQGQGVVSGNLQQETLVTNGFLQFAASTTTPPDVTPPTQTSTTINYETDNFVTNEASGAVSIVVTRQGDLDKTSTVEYRTIGGFALIDQDYTAVEGVLTFNPGESRKTFTVPLTNDTVAEGVETFSLELTGAVGATLGDDRTTIVTIIDNDNVNPPGSLNVQVPEGFSVNRIAAGSNFAGPTGLKIAEDGRVFVTEKFGRIFVVENGLRIETPFLDLTDQVYSVGTSQGLAGFALDPNFDSNGHVYVLYTANENGTRFGRLERYTVSASDPNRIDASSRLILIGNTAADGFPDGGDIHLIGDLQFGSDGSLLVSYGDAAGNGNNAAALNAQNLDNLAGMIARVNPNNGQGYASNPFFTGDVNDVRSKIWAYGLRNPYRFEVANDGSTNPNDGRPGTLYIGDVQFLGAEELNVSRGGENFGWPFFEGDARFLGNENPANFVGPEVAFPRSQAQTSIGGAVIESPGWPDSYVGNYLHADFSAGWIRSFALDDNGNIVGQRDFATGARGITDLEWDQSTGQMYFVALNQANNFSGELYAITYTGTAVNTFEPTEIATGADGAAFAVTTANEVWRRDGNSWTQLPGNFQKITVANANEVYGIDEFGNVSRFDGNQWSAIGGEAVSDIGVSGNGQLWAIGLTNNVLQRVGDAWVNIGGTLVDIEVDSEGNVWGVNPAGQIWRRVGTTWGRISGTLVDISVGADGAVFGTNAANQVWSFLGGVWRMEDVSLTTIAVTSETDVWGVDPDGLVRRFDGTSWSVV